MKKLLTLILALAMVFSLCACGAAEKPAETQTAGSPTQDMANAGSPTQDMANAEKPAEAPAADAKHYKMGLAMNSLQAPAFHAWADYLDMRLQYEAEQRGYTVELITLNAENDVTQQANDIKDLIAAGCDVIFCPCLDSNAILQSVSEVHKAGIPYMSSSDMFAIGIDLLVEGYNDTAVDQGCYNFAVNAAAAAFDLLEGKEVEPVQNVLGTQATNENIEEILATIPLWGNDYRD